MSNDCWGAHIYDALGICSPKISGGPLYKLGKSTGSKSIVEVDLPQQASALIPISDIIERASSKLAELLGGELKNHGRTGNHNELAARHLLFWEVISPRSEVCSVNISRPSVWPSDVA
jgi:hypothetical protein